MSLAFNNSAANILNTPGFISDIFASIPNASYVAIGTIFIATDTGAIYQSDGTNWYSLGGGGGSQNLQQVLAVGNTATNDHIELYDTTVNTFSGFYYANLIQLLDFSSNYIFIDNTTGNPFIEFNTSGLGLSKLNYNSLTFTNDNITSITCVDTLNTNSTNLNLTSQIFVTSFNNQGFGIRIDTVDYRYSFGDYDNLFKGTAFIIDDNFEEISSKMGGVFTGLLIDRVLNVFLGDYTGNINTNYLQFDNNAGDFLLYTNTAFFNIQGLRLNDGGTGSLLSATSGGNSGQHLNIIIDGTPYKIELKNP